jgi:hypothetical protein
MQFCRPADESNALEDSVLISTEPIFSEGGIFSDSLCTNALAQSFYNEDGFIIRIL